MLSLSPGGALGEPGEDDVWTPENKTSLTLHTLHPRVTEFIWCGRKFG